MIHPSSRLTAPALLLASTLAWATSPPVLERSEEDAARDVTSKPFIMLEFFGVQPGWDVMDMFAGNGYYSELLSHRVGPEGRVYVHNNAAYMGFATKLGARLANDRLPNAIMYQRELKDVNLPSDSLDMVLLVMTYHDAYYTFNGWDVTVEPLMKTVNRVLKPGGVLAVIDHHAEANTGARAAQNLHRIDVAFAREDIARFGFRLDATSTALENPDDDLTVSVFDPAVRGRTSRFAYRFIKGK